MGLLAYGSGGEEGRTVAEVSPAHAPQLLALLHLLLHRVRQHLYGTHRTAQHKQNVRLTPLAPAVLLKSRLTVLRSRRG